MVRIACATRSPCVIVPERLPPDRLTPLQEVLVEAGVTLCEGVTVDQTLTPPRVLRIAVEGMDMGTRCAPRTYRGIMLYRGSMNKEDETAPGRESRSQRPGHGEGRALLRMPRTDIRMLLRWRTCGSGVARVSHAWGVGIVTKHSPAPPMRGRGKNPTLYD